MVTITLGLVLTMMAQLEETAPKNKAAQNVAAAIVRAVDMDNPIFGSPVMDASVLVEMGFRESSWLPMQVGDHHRALCEYQLQNAPIDVLWDLDLCTRIAYQRLRQSAIACPDAPIAPYAGGSCRNRTARRISAARMREADRIGLVALPDEDFYTEMLP